jgi:hypothetical protein
LDVIAGVNWGFDHENQQGNKENIESTMNMKDKMIMK